MKKIGALILSLLLGMVSTFCVYAKDENKIEEQTCLSLNYEKGEGVFTLYRVAQFSETGKFILEEPFSNYQIKLEDLDSEGWRALAETLEGYVKKDQITPLDKQKTDDKGNIEWKNLEKGLYLVLGEQTKDEQYLYTPMPTLITLPNRMQNGEWDYHVKISLKYSQEEIFQEQEIDFDVIKIWKNEPNKENRPKKIVVHLLKDGNIYDTVELKKENNWQYTWEKLPLQASWLVVEKEVPENYTVTSTREGNSFILTNTYTSSKENKKQEQMKHPKLPQTGQLWWPVPVLFAFGLLLIMVGAKKHKK